jgi:GcrA cell cycle regulator
MSWTEERVELLRRLWQEGRSASQIAGELGGVTRNAVIGKVHRLGLSGRGQPTSSIKRQRKPRLAPSAPNPRRPRRPLTIGNNALKADFEPMLQARPRPMDSVVVPIAKRLSIDKLTERTCKWPIGDPGEADFHFCGHDSLDGAPYCQYHARIAYQAPEARRRTKQAAYG